MNDAHRESAIPWTRISLFAVGVGPAAAIGGVPTWVVPAFVGGVLLLVVSIAARAGGETFRVPRWWIFGALAAVACLAQLLPLSPAGLRAVAPGLAATVERSVVDTPASDWSRISVLPGATALECARLVALTVLFICASQLSWRISATTVVAAGSLVGLVGLAQLVTGSTAIYGVFDPVDRIAAPDAGLLTSFVNPNHQSSLLMLGVFTAVALGLDQHRRSHESRDARRADRHAEWSWVAAGCAGLQLLVLALSLSRAALLVALLIAAPVTVLAVRGRSRLGLRRAGRRGALLVLTALIGLALLGARLGAWRALRTIDAAAYQAKFASVRDALDLIRRSPWLGTGRGTFVDLFPLVDRNRELTEITVTHIESSPIAALVEFGPAIGGLLLIGAMIWWVDSLRANPATSRRIALLGVAAVALHNLADFNLEFLGVAAPLVALCGGLSSRRRDLTWPRGRVLVGSLSALAFALALACWGAARGWPQLRDRHVEVADGRRDALALADRPLDARVHTALARRAAMDERWSAARTRARVASELLPSSADAWLLLAASEQALGEELASDQAMSIALKRIRVRPDAAMVAHLSSGRSASRLAPLVDPEDPRWPAILAGLAEHEPAYAEELVAELVVAHPEDPRLLRFQAERALAHDQADLALHFSRLACAIDPASAESWVLQASALRHSLRAVTEADIQALLEHARGGTLDRPDLVEEALILSYLADGGAEAVRAAESLLPKLLERDAVPEVQRRRRALGRAIAERRQAAVGGR